MRPWISPNIVPSGSSMVLCSDPGGHPEESEHMAQCSVLRPMEKPIGKTTHHWPSVPKTRTRTHGETHIEETTLRAASTKGAGRPPLPIPLYGCLHGYGFVSLERPARLSAFIVRRCVVLPMGFPMGLSTEPSIVLPMGVPMGLSPVPWNSHLVLYHRFNFPVGIESIWLWPPSAPPELPGTLKREQ